MSLDFEIHFSYSLGMSAGNVPGDYECPRCNGNDFYWSNQQRTQNVGGWIGPFGISGGQRQEQFTKKLPFCRACKEQMNPTQQLWDRVNAENAIVAKEAWSAKQTIPVLIGVIALLVVVGLVASAVIDAILGI